MARNIHGVHEPLVHISKREECGFFRACLVRLAAIALALVVCGVVIVALTGLNPVEVYAGVIDGAVGSGRRLWVTVRDTLSLLLVAVALTPAFKMRFWNVGGEGQVLIGATATAAVMINFAGKLPAPALFAAMIGAAVLAGMVWGVIPALFKAGWNTNETLFTLMMNYVATQFVAFCVVYWENPAGSNSVGIINAKDKAGWLPELFGLTYGWNLVIVLVITAFMYVYLRYSKQGYEIAYHGHLRRALWPDRLHTGQRLRAHRVHHTGGRPGLHGHHRGLALQAEYVHDGDGVVPADLHGQGRDPDRQPVQPERERQRDHHRHHTVLRAGL